MIQKIKKHLKLARGYEFIRRYFVMNSFDGVLTVLGILVGAYVSDSIEPTMIIKISIAAGLAMFISGSFGTYMTEDAERKKSLKETERALLSELKDSRINKANITAAIISSLVNGISPLFSSIIVITPFFFTAIISATTAFYLSIGISLTTLFLLGIFLGRVSKEKVIISGVKMLAIGILSILVTSLLGLM